MNKLDFIQYNETKDITPIPVIKIKNNSSTKFKLLHSNIYLAINIKHSDLSNEDQLLFKKQAINSYKSIILDGYNSNLSQVIQSMLFEVQNNSFSSTGKSQSEPTLYIPVKLSNHINEEELDFLNAYKTMDKKFIQNYLKEVLVEINSLDDNILKYNLLTSYKKEVSLINKRFLDNELIERAVDGIY
jgi:hypothetical protein